MRALLVGGQFVALLGMVGASVWGRKHMDDAARVRARVGASGFDWTMGKNTALLYTPVIGALIVVATITLTDSADPDTIPAIGLAIMVMLLLAHWSSIRRSAR